ncbi:MAG: radical SAM family heme chaperone HemW [Labrys sp. (in: a-proteobacteria)]
MAATAPSDIFGVYVHWPFCQAKCPYCDFNSHVRTTAIDQDRYVAAFAREIAQRAEIAPGRTVSSIFFGGGTPSLMQPRTVAGIIEAISRHWTLLPDAEITLEANPTSVEVERFRGYRSAGVNRVSLGVQALNDADLKSLGRLHSADEALRAVATAASIFERYSFDLIYARPGQSPADWRAELTAALSHAGDHLSLYQLTIEPDTMFERLVAAGKLVPMDDDAARDLWDITQEVCEAAGLPAYEISNHARPGGESRHNLVYWRYGEYAGVGPGAHGRLVDAEGRRLAMATERSPEAWLATVEARGEALVENTPLDREEQADEFLLMGLRLVEGIDLRRFETVRGRPIKHQRLKALIEEGMLARLGPGRVAVTREGFPLLDAVVADLAA